MLENAKKMKNCDAYHINWDVLYYINQANKEKYTGVASAARVQFPGSG